MCGILFSARPVTAEDGSVHDQFFHELHEQLQFANGRRGLWLFDFWHTSDSTHHELFSTLYLGPDAQDTVVVLEGNCRLSFTASELRLRGEAYVSQPHKDDQGNLLCWNGEVCYI